MTLREIFTKISLSAEQIQRDLEAAVNQSPIDWPLYLLILAVIVGCGLWVITLVVFGKIGDVWDWFWKQQFDSQGVPLSNFGKMVHIISQLLGYLGAIFSVWAIGYIITSGLFLMIVGAELSKPAFQHMLVYGLPTVVCVIVIILAAKGRNVSSQSKR